MSLERKILALAGGAVLGFWLSGVATGLAIAQIL